MNPEEMTRAFLIAYELLEQHGDSLRLFLDGKIIETQSEGDIEQLEAWLVIRDAALTVLDAYSRPMH